MSKTHILETEATCWEAVERGEKRFEVQRNDRFFQRGDLVTLRKLTVDGKRYAGVGFQTIDITFRIGWILQGGQFGVEPGYIVFQLEPTPEPEGSA